MRRGVLIFRRVYSLVKEPYSRVVTLKVPVSRTSNKKSSPVKDKLQVLQISDKEGEEILQKFILPSKDDKTKSLVKPKKAKTVDVIDKDVMQVANAFGLRDDDQLPLVKPKSIQESPFEYMSNHNSDRSLVKSPRLSVTKLLTKLWCELRQYYEVYAGSPKRAQTVSMEIGTEHHLQLELATHKPVDVTNLHSIIHNNELRLVETMNQRVQETLDPHLLEVLQETNRAVLELLKGRELENTLAMDWLNNVMMKLVTLVRRSDAREILVHGYANFETGEYRTKLPLHPRRDVMVSGIIDYLKITPEEDYRFFKELEEWSLNEFPQVNGMELVDLTKFIPMAKQLIHEYEAGYSLAVVDVKTRQNRRLPGFESVLQGAKLQVANYRKLLAIMGDNQTIAYNMLLENARRRHIDVDYPIALQTALEMLRTSGDLVFKDFIRLAQGQPIGFEPYDKFIQETYLQGDHVPFYDFTHLLDEGKQDEFINEEGFDYSVLLTPEIIRVWKVPLTLRYFAARSSQMYEMIEPLLKEDIAVEYHDRKTGECFSNNQYKYNEVELDQQLHHAVEFWNGSRAPEAVDNLSKCKWCQFSSRCSIPNPHLSFSLGQKLRHLVQ